MGAGMITKESELLAILLDASQASPSTCIPYIERGGGPGVHIDLT